MFGWIHGFIENKFLFLVLLNGILIIVNMIEIFSAIIIFVPLIIPIAAQYGINPVHLGITFLLNLEIGYMLPPLALNLFIGSLRFEKPITQLYRAVLPFLLILLIMLCIIMFYPDLSLWLVRTLNVK